METLLHEMIHAFLFVTDNNDDDHDGRGPEFHKHMYRINAATGAGISVYHRHDEVELTRHWWRCDGPCTKRPPFYGSVKRPMNRAPGPNDRRVAGGVSIRLLWGSFNQGKEPEATVRRRGRRKKTSRLQSLLAGYQECWVREKKIRKLQRNLRSRRINAKRDCGMQMKCQESSRGTLNDFW